MKAYQTRNAVAIRKRVRKAHSKAKFAGLLYLLGSLALLALACMPTLTIGGKDLWLLNFWKPFSSIAKANRDLLAIITSALYAIILLTCLFKFFGCLGKLCGLTRKSTRYVNGYNKNMRAMERMAKLFSRSFSAIINCYILIYVLQPSAVEKALTIYAYAILGIGLFVHFIAGLVGGLVGLYFFAGIVISILDYCKVLK